MDTKEHRSFIETKVNELAHHLRESGLSSRMMITIQDDASQEAWAAVFCNGQLMEGPLQVAVIANEVGEFAKRIEITKARLKLGKLMVHTK